MAISGQQSRICIVAFLLRTENVPSKRDALTKYYLDSMEYSGQISQGFLISMQPAGHMITIKMY